MVTRTSWDREILGNDQHIARDKALRVNALNGAYNSHEEGIKGSIKQRKRADFLALPDDPRTVDTATTIDTAKIKDIQTVRAVAGGVTIVAYGYSFLSVRMGSIREAR